MMMAMGLALLASISVGRADDDTMIAGPTSDTQSDAGQQAASAPTVADSGSTTAGGDTSATGAGDTSASSAGDTSAPSAGNASSTDAGTSNLDDPAAVASGGPALATGTAVANVTFGVFRENLPDTPVSQRNCWVQAMISGEVINGELLASRVIYAQAQCVLNVMTRSGLCANQRLAPTWSARPEQDVDSAGPGQASAGGTGDDLDVTSWNQDHAYPGRRRHEFRVSQGGDSWDQMGAGSNLDGWSGYAGNFGQDYSPRSTSSYWASRGCGSNEQSGGRHHRHD
jgi:hypothetical protein